MNLMYMSQTQKIAGLLIAMGPDNASEILKHIKDEALLEQITLDIANLNNVPTKLLNAIVGEFYSIFCENKQYYTGGAIYAKSVLEKAYGKERAENIASGFMCDINSNPFEFFEQIEPAQLLGLLEGESPDDIALMLVHLSSGLSGEILNFLEKEIRNKTVMQIAKLQDVPIETVRELYKKLEKKYFKYVNSKSIKSGGLDFAMRLISQTDLQTARSIIEELSASSKTLALKLKNIVLEYDDIFSLDGQSTQKLLTEVDLRDLAISLKGTKEEQKQTILNNLEEKAKNVLKDEMEYLGPFRNDEITAAKDLVTAIAKDLSIKGELTKITQ